MSSILNRLKESEKEIVDRHRESRPVRVGQLARDLGLSVTVASMDPKISGMILPSEESASGFQIRVNRFEIPERQRFTIAHEIGHYLLHRDLIKNGIVDNVLYRSRLSSRIEAEANRVAAEILMPLNLLRADSQTVGEGNCEVERLAELYRVSKQAMEIRLS